MKISKEAIEAGVRALWKVTPGSSAFDMTQAVLEAALPHLQDCKVSPQTVQSPPATATQVAIDDEEVERVGKAIYDEVVLQPIVAIGPYVADPTHEASRNARWAARAAIRAIREGGQRWGVWVQKHGTWISTYPIHDSDFTTTEFVSAQTVCSLMNGLYPDGKYEVRPYPGEREKTPEEIADECCRDVTFWATASMESNVKSKIAAAIRDAKENSNGK